MRTVAVVQARMGSTRLPGKSAMKICGMPLIWHVLKRVQQSMVDEVVLALPSERNTDVLAESAALLGIRAFSFVGDDADLIGRYTKAALATDATTIVRVPGDNPCVDPEEINRIIRLFRNTVRSGLTPHWLWSNLDRNISDNGYPGGLGAEVYSDEFLFWLHKNVYEPELREHPHKWAFQRNKVCTMMAHHEIARPHLRFDVNTQDDFNYITGIYEGLYYTNPNFRIRDILKFLGEHNGKCIDMESHQS